MNLLGPSSSSLNDLSLTSFLKEPNELIRTFSLQMTSLWKVVILVTQERKERREKRESFVRKREERKKRVFFDYSSILKTLSLELRRCPLTGKAWRSKRIEEKIVDCENQET